MLAKPELIDIPRNYDERGFFEQTFSREALLRIPSSEKYFASSMTIEPFTVRGLHYQTGDYGEAKLVRVIQGKILDVLVSTDETLALEQRIFEFELSDDVPQALFVPRGFAHGFQTLISNTLVLYCLDSTYSKSNSRGYNPLSPELAQIWRQAPARLKDEDLLWPNI